MAFQEARPTRGDVAVNTTKAPLGEELDFLFRAIDGLEKEIGVLAEQVAHVTREHPPLAGTTGCGAKETAAPPEPYRSHSVDSLRDQRKRIVTLTDRLNDIRTRLDV